MLQAACQTACRLRHFRRAPAVYIGGPLTVRFGLVAHLGRIRFQPAGLQLVVLEDLHGLGHGADLIAPVRSVDVGGKVAIGKPLHGAGKPLHRRDKPGADREISGDDHRKETEDDRYDGNQRGLVARLRQSAALRVVAGCDFRGDLRQFRADPGEDRLAFHAECLLRCQCLLHVRCGAAQIPGILARNIVESQRFVLECGQTAVTGDRGDGFIHQLGKFPTRGLCLDFGGGIALFRKGNHHIGQSGASVQQGMVCQCQVKGCRAVMLDKVAIALVDCLDLHCGISRDQDCANAEQRKYRQEFSNDRNISHGNNSDRKLIPSWVLCRHHALLLGIIYLVN
ncbi:hypothetical protein D3C72_1247260 [compost metagenome]